MVFSWGFKFGVSARLDSTQLKLVAVANARARQPHGPQCPHPHSIPIHPDSYPVAAICNLPSFFFLDDSRAYHGLGLGGNPVWPFYTYIWYSRISSARFVSSLPLKYYVVLLAPLCVVSLSYLFIFLSFFLSFWDVCIIICIITCLYVCFFYRVVLQPFEESLSLSTMWKTLYLESGNKSKDLAEVVGLINQCIQPAF